MNERTNERHFLVMDMSVAPCGRGRVGTIGKLRQLSLFLAKSSWRAGGVGRNLTWRV